MAFVMQNRRVSCVIAAYNENNRILSVLSALKKVKDICEIIVVDDGSTDHTAALVRNNYPEIILLRLHTNRGKSEAVMAGIAKAKGESILLFDADMRNIQPSEIQALIGIWKRHPKNGMCILSRKHAPWISRFLRWSVIFSGERIVRKRDMMDLYHARRFCNFQIETAINQYMIDHGRACGHVPYSGVNSYGWQKHTPAGFIIKYARMTNQIVRAYGIRKLLYQTLYFARNRLT